MKFQFTQLLKENDIILYLLNKDNELFSINYKGAPVSTNISNMKSIVDFDVLPCFNNYHAFSILKDNGDAYAYWGLIYNPENNSDKSEATFHKAGEDITSVKSYCMGTAMLDMQGNIRLFGSDSSSRIPEDYELVLMVKQYSKTSNLYMVPKKHSCWFAKTANWNNMVINRIKLIDR